MVKITTACPMCEKSVSIETSASAFKFDPKSRGLAVTITCTHCGRQFPHALNKKDKSKDGPGSAPKPTAGPSSPAIPRPSTLQVSGMPEKGTDSAPAPLAPMGAAPPPPAAPETSGVFEGFAGDRVNAPEVGKPVFAPLGGMPARRPGMDDAAPAPAPAPLPPPPTPTRGSATFSPAVPSRSSPGFEPPGAKSSKRASAEFGGSKSQPAKPLPPAPAPPPTMAVPMADGGKKKMPEWMQYLLLIGGIGVIGIVIFAIPSGDSAPATKKTEPTEAKAKDKPPPPTNPVQPPKKYLVAPMPRPAGTPLPPRE